MRSTTPSQGQTRSRRMNETRKNERKKNEKLRRQTRKRPRARSKNEVKQPIVKVATQGGSCLSLLMYEHRSKTARKGSFERVEFVFADEAVLFFKSYKRGRAGCGDNYRKIVGIQHTSRLIHLRYRRISLIRCCDSET